MGDLAGVALFGGKSFRTSPLGHVLLGSVRPHRPVTPA